MTIEDQRENEEISSDADAASTLETASESGADDQGAGKKTLGVERWVQLAFVVAALTFVWLYDHLISAVWYNFADPDESIVTVLAIFAGVLSTIVLYRQQPVYSTIHDTADELAKVTWPTRKETSSSTVVVVVTSIVAALMLFLFDSVWSAVTDLVYKV